MAHKTKAQKAKMATRELPEEDPEFQIAPMIDILLVLLVFFMSISSTQVLQVNDKVKLPVAKEGKEIKGETGGKLIVNILWVPISNTSVIDMNDREYMDAEMLIPEFQRELQKSAETQVFIRADKELRYDYLRKVLVAAGKAGIKNVTFSVVDKEGGK